MSDVIEATARAICCPNGCMGSPSSGQCIAYQVEGVAQAALRAALEAARLEERERCAKIADRGHCTASGCDPQTTGHSKLCPVGIATAIRKETRDGMV